MNSQDHLIQLINKLGNLDENSTDFLVKKIKVVNFKKNEIILKQGEVSNYIYFINFGMVRFYYYDENQNDISTYFISENNFFSNMSSFFGNMPSSSNIQAIEHTEAYKISKSDLQELFSLSPEMNIIGRELIQKSMTEFLTKQQNHLLKNLAENRYESILKNDPDLIKRVPIKYLATYIGVHPNSLSRIRKNITKIK